MMWRSTVGIVVTLSLLTVPLAAEAQQAGGTVTIGYLGNSSPSLESNLVEAFREGLRHLGYVEGQNLVIRYQWAEGQQERSAVLAREDVCLKPDILLTAGTPGTLAAKHATQSIPIVTAIAGDPVAAGLVPNKEWGQVLQCHMHSGVCSLVRSGKPRLDSDNPVSRLPSPCLTVACRRPPIALYLDSR